MPPAERAPAKLSAAEVGGYERDGFVLSVPAVTPAEADGLRLRLEAFERAIGGPLTSPALSRYRFRTHVLLTWVNDLARHPAILDAVELGRLPVGVAQGLLPLEDWPVAWRRAVWAKFPGHSSRRAMPVGRAANPASTINVICTRCSEP